LFKETDKSTPSTADFTKPVDSENQISINDNVTSPIEVMSTTPDNFDNLDDSISKDTSSQIQHPIYE
ncbi:10733_t:CDS:2, partial [Funneliformis caledonium]